MEDGKLGAVEARFADIIWERAPLRSSELVVLAARELGWKKSTTYTVLKKLCGRGLFSNDGGTVTALVSREAYYAQRGEKLVEEAFQGSLPAFIAAFTARRGLTEAEAEQIRALIDDHRREGTK